jgi:hypothetical protein
MGRIKFVAAAARIVQETGIWPLAIGFWQKQSNLQQKACCKSFPHLLL